MRKEIVTCKRCVMDNESDPSITFDSNGYCNYCTDALELKENVYFPNEEGKKKLDDLLTEIKEHGKGHKYDCIMGISGGLDSSYLTYLGKKWGLRIILIHIDDGFDTEISANNLERLVSATGFDYVVVKPDPEQYDGLNTAYMRASVSNLAIPQDNILIASIYKFMQQENLKYFLSGGNFALESILERVHFYDSMDTKNISDINKKYGRTKIDKLDFINGTEKLKIERVLKIQSPRPLNFLDYNKNRAFEELRDYCGFEYYGDKHLENIWTAFNQLYWLPNKFNVDIRKSHLSSLIISDQLTRDEALQELSKPLCDENLLNSYLDIIKKRLHLSNEEFDEIMESSTAKHTDYKTADFSNWLRKVYRKIRR